MKIEVDLANDSRPQIIAAAKFILEHTGYVAERTDVPVPTVQVITAPPPAAVFQAPAFSDNAPPPPPPPPQAFGIDLDSAGLPWDGRIHSSSRAKLDDGTWRQKRGVDKTLLATVNAELQGVMSIPVPQPQVALTPEAAFVAAVVPPPFAAPVESSAPLIPPPPATIPPPPTAGITPAGVATTASPSSPAVGATSLATFPTLMKLVTAEFAAKRVTQATINEAIAAVGLPSLPMLSQRPDLIPQFAQLLGIAL